jgi:glutathione S-transferase
MRIKLIYGNIPFWRAEVSRLALFIANIPFEDQRISREEFSAMKLSGELPFGQMPVLEVDGNTLAQTGAIARFCGKQANLYPTDDFNAAKVDEAIDLATDITSLVSPSMREKDTEKKAAMRTQLATTTLPKYFGFLEMLLEQNGDTGYYVGDCLSIADLAIWRLLGWLASGMLDGIPTDVMAPFPLVTAHFQAIEAHPKVRSWMDSHYG